ncbi:hypothetical protein JOD18_004643 [Gracilibacillus alcaliphilus]|nr:hypothetical protein [Gracilibacillus alcaliphilus]
MIIKAGTWQSLSHDHQLFLLIGHNAIQDVQRKTH